MEILWPFIYGVVMYAICAHVFMFEGICDGGGGGYMTMVVVL